MAVILNQIFALFRLLNSETGANQIASGIAFGVILGFAPSLSLQSLIVFICIFLFRIQIGAAFLSAFFFAFIAWLIDPLAHRIGAFVLELDSLRGFFTLLYNMPVIPFTKFYNSITMGSGILSILLAPFVFIGSKSLIIRYRASVLEKLKDNKWWKLWTGTTIYKWYLKYESIAG